HRDMAYLSRQLATIKVDCEPDVKVGELVPRTPDRDALTEQYRSLAFKAWLDERRREAKAAGDSVEPADESPAVEAEYETILDQQRLDHWLQQLREAPLFAFDTETTSQYAQQAELVGVSFAVEPHRAAYVPLAHSYMGVPQQLDRDQVLAQLKPLL